VGDGVASGNVGGVDTSMAEGTGSAAAISLLVRVGCNGLLALRLGDRLLGWPCVRVVAVARHARLCRRLLRLRIVLLVTVHHFPLGGGLLLGRRLLLLAVAGHLARRLRLAAALRRRLAAVVILVVVVAVYHLAAALGPLANLLLRRVVVVRPAAAARRGPLLVAVPDADHAERATGSGGGLRDLAPAERPQEGARAVHEARECEGRRDLVVHEGDGHVDLPVAALDGALDLAVPPKLRQVRAGAAEVGGALGVQRQQDLDLAAGLGDLRRCQCPAPGLGNIDLLERTQRRPRCDGCRRQRRDGGGGSGGGGEKREAVIAVVARVVRARGAAAAGVCQCSGGRAGCQCQCQCPIDAPSGAAALLDSTDWKLSVASHVPSKACSFRPCTPGDQSSPSTGAAR